MKMSDDATLNAAFAAFWVDAERSAGRCCLREPGKPT